MGIVSIPVPNLYSTRSGLMFDSSKKTKTKHKQLGSGSNFSSEYQFLKKTKSVLVPIQFLPIVHGTIS
jgi:hypothetical protein